MRSDKRVKGFTILEVLIVAGIISILVSMAGLITAKYFTRRDIDRVTYNISSNLILAKLQASRNGVEYQTETTYSADNNEIVLVTKRGSSNTNTDFTNTDSYDEVANQTISVNEQYNITINPAGSNFQFNPDGTSSALSLDISPNADANINKCGSVVLSSFGRISTVIGNWDSGTNTCVRIADAQESPS